MYLKELEKAGYIVRTKRTLVGRGLRHIRADARAGSSYQWQQTPISYLPMLEKPPPLNKDISSKEQSITDLSSTHFFLLPKPLVFCTIRSGCIAEKKTETKSNSTVEIYS